MSSDDVGEVAGLKGIGFNRGCGAGGCGGEGGDGEDGDCGNGVDGREAAASGFLLPSLRRELGWDGAEE